MANEPVDMIMPMLREIRGEMRQRFDAIDERLDRLELGQKNFRNALTADTLLSKLVTGEFEQRMPNSSVRSMKS